MTVWVTSPAPAPAGWSVAITLSAITTAAGQPIFDATGAALTTGAGDALWVVSTTQGVWTNA